MKPIDAPRLRGGASGPPDPSAKDNAALSIGDGPPFVLAETDDFEEEVRLVRENRELMEFLRKRSAPGKTYTLKEVRNELGL